MQAGQADNRNGAMKLSKGYYHLAGIIVVAVWGTTFISTKVLIGNGLAPQEIFFYRFLIAYAGIWFVSRGKLFAENVKDEVMLALAGLFGGSLYFFTENTALGITQASNVSFLLCGTPLITTLLSKIFYRDVRISWKFVAGSLAALAGVGMVVFEGASVLKISPAGDLLTLAASFSWGFYSIVIRRLENRYSTAFITRKVFFYGLATICPVFIFEPMDIGALFSSGLSVWLNLIFLAVIASLVCFVVWNSVIKEIGIVKATNYVYLSPVVTLAVSAAVLGERMGPVALAGAACIMGGVYWAGRN